MVAGGCSGADELAVGWAVDAQVDYRVFPARWRVEGKVAGPVRNQRMLDVCHPVLVVAFPGGRGTGDMVRRAQGAGVEVRVVEG